MRLKINPQVFQDTARVKAKLQKLAQDIKIDTENKVQEVTTLGFNYAFNLAPEYTGELKAAMRFEFPSMNRGLIISSQPLGDLIPTHILFDLGIYPRPRISSSLGFMKQTAIFLEQEFTKRLEIAIHHSIEKFGKVR